MISKTTGKDYLCNLPKSIQYALKTIQILRNEYNNLFEGNEDMLATFGDQQKLILRAKRNVLLKTPSLSLRKWTTCASYQWNEKDYQFVIDCLHDMLTSIEFQGSYSSVSVCEQVYKNHRTDKKYHLIKNLAYECDDHCGRIHEVLEEKYSHLGKIFYITERGSTLLVKENYPQEDIREEYIEYILFIKKQGEE